MAAFHAADGGGTPSLPSGKAAEQGHVVAQHELGLLCMRGAGGVTNNFAESVREFVCYYRWNNEIVDMKVDVSSGK